QAPIPEAVADARVGWRRRQGDQPAPQFGDRHRVQPEPGVRASAVDIDLDVHGAVPWVRARVGGPPTRCRPPRISVDPLTLAVAAIEVAAESGVRAAVRGLRVENHHTTVVGVSGRGTTGLVPPEVLLL